MQATSNCNKMPFVRVWIVLALACLVTGDKNTTGVPPSDLRLPSNQKCDTCEPPGSWVLYSGYSECTGTCFHKTKYRVEICSDTIRQNGCQKHVRENCDPHTTCDGDWESWQSLTTCNLNRLFKLQRRRCMKNGLTSTNCARTRLKYQGDRLFPCNYIKPGSEIPKQPSSTSTEGNGDQEKTTLDLTTITSQTAKGRNVGNENPTSKTTNFPEHLPTLPEKLPNCNKVMPIDWWTGRSYIFILQALIIILLVGAIIYLVYKNKREKKQMMYDVYEEQKRLRESPQPYNHIFPPGGISSQNTLVTFLNSPEYETMLPDRRSSCASFQRPLPSTPTSTQSSPKLPTRNSTPPQRTPIPTQRTTKPPQHTPTLPKRNSSRQLPAQPMKPPRRNRPFSQVPSTFHLSPSSLDLPAQSHLAHSAPNTPRNSFNKRDKRYATISKSEYFLEPFN